MLFHGFPCLNINPYLGHDVSKTEYSADSLGEIFERGYGKCEGTSTTHAGQTRQISSHTKWLAATRNIAPVFMRVK